MVKPKPSIHELTDIQKGGIIALSHHYKPPKIGTELNIPHQTIWSFLKRYQERDSTENLPRSSRPQLLSDSSDRWLAREALSETRLPLKELKSICNIEVSERTLLRHLQEKGIRCWRVVKRAMLTEKHAKARLV